MSRRNQRLLILFILTAIGCTIWCVYGVLKQKNLYLPIFCSIYLLAIPSMIVYVFRLCGRAPIQYRIIIIWCCEVIFFLGFLLSPILAILYLREELYHYTEIRRQRK